MSDDKRITISFDEAVKRLPEGQHIHTFRESLGGVLLGADHNREPLIASMRKAKVIDVTGPAAQAMGHGLAIQDDYGVLFIETIKANTG